MSLMSPSPTKGRKKWQEATVRRRRRVGRNVQDVHDWKLNPPAPFSRMGFIGAVREWPNRAPC